MRNGIQRYHNKKKPFGNNRRLKYINKINTINTWGGGLGEEERGALAAVIDDIKERILDQRMHASRTTGMQGCVSPWLSCHRRRMPSGSGNRRQRWMEKGGSSHKSIHQPSITCRDRRMKNDRRRVKKKRMRNFGFF